MQIHHGKHHAKQIECGLCAFKAKDLQRLKHHLTTCEPYECVECEYVAKQRFDMKKLISEKNCNNCSSSYIFHLKIDRNKELEANFKEYQQSDLF